MYWFVLLGKKLLTGEKYTKSFGGKNLYCDFGQI